MSTLWSASGNVLAVPHTRRNGLRQVLWWRAACSIGTAESMAMTSALG